MDQSQKSLRQSKISEFFAAKQSKNELKIVHKCLNIAVASRVVAKKPDPKNKPVFFNSHLKKNNKTHQKTLFIFS